MLRTSSQILLLSSFLLVPVTSAAQAQCGGVPGLIASLVKNVPEAQTFCSSKYPQPAVTTTLAPQTVLATSTVQNTLTLAALTVTETAPEVTITSTVSTSIVTETTTTTVTAAPLAKREVQDNAGVAARHQPTSASKNCGNSRECAFQTLRSALPALASSICKCIQTPSTVTATPVASTSTVLTTAVVTETPPALTNTITPTATLSVTLTTTTTVTSTVTYTPPPNNPLPRCDPNGHTGCSSGCQCDPMFGGANANLAFCFAGGAQLIGSCSSNADCSADSFCDTDFQKCISAAGCTSSYVPPSKLKRTEGSGLVIARDARVRNKIINGLKFTEEQNGKKI